MQQRFSRQRGGKRCPKGGSQRITHRLRHFFSDPGLQFPGLPVQRLTAPAVLLPELPGPFSLPALRIGHDRFSFLRSTTVRPAGS